MKYVFLLLLTIFSLKLESSNEKIILATPITFPSATRLSENTIRMPFTLMGNLITIQAQVNGETGPFIIDTGSYAMVLNKRIYGEGTSTRKTTYSINKEMEGVEETFIHDFKLDDFKIHAYRADLVDLSHIEISKKKRINGILGYYNLKPFEIYIDFYLKQITIFKTRANGSRIDEKYFTDVIQDTLIFKRKGHSIVLQLPIENEELNIVLDTGAEINQLSKNLSAPVLARFKPLDKVNLAGMDGREKEVVAGLFNPFVKTRFKTKEMPTVISSMEFAKKAFGTKVDGIIGYWFLENKRILINYKKKSLYFARWPD